MDVVHAENREAVDILEAISRDKANRELYFARQMAIHDAVTREKHALEKGIRIGEEKGRMEGREEGIEKGQYEAGIKLARNGMALEAISSILDLNEERLKQLLNGSDGQE